MNRFLFIFFALTAVLNAAIGDISAVIRPDGYSVDIYVEGFTTGATIATGHTGSYNSTSIDTPYFTVVSKGFDSTGVATTTTRTVHIGTAMRKPYPNEASIDEDTSSVPGSLRIRFSLSKPIYAKDDVGAGNSGTAPTFTATSGFIVNTGGASQSSGSLSSSSVVTNDSILAYPSDIRQWDWKTTKPFMRKTSNFDVGFRATHAFGIAAVRIDATGVSSEVNVTETISEVSKIGPCASGLYYDSFKMTVPIAGFTQGEQIRLRARVYPRVGDTPSDTENLTSISQSGNGRVEVTCDKDGSLAVYAVVKTAAAGGNDTTGATSSSLETAEATPYATIVEAINDNATIIYGTDDGTAIHNLAQTAIKTQPFAIEFRPHPSDVASNITLSVTSAAGNIRCKHLYIGGGINVNLGGASNYLDGNRDVYDSTITIESVNFDGTSGSGRSNVWRFSLANFIDVTFSTYNLAQYGIDPVAWSATGCILASSSSESINGFGSLVANSMGNSEYRLSISDGTTSNPTVTTRNLMIEFNNFDRHAPTSSSQTLDITDTTNGDISIRGNVIINSGTSEGDQFLGNNISIENVLITHNTIQGIPFALLYDTNATVYTVNNVYVQGNALYRMSIKSDLFDDAIVDPDGTRVDNWWIVFGCGITNNRIDGSVGFLPEWAGQNSGMVGDSGTYSELGYTTDYSRVGTGDGGGNYLPSTGSVLKNAMEASDRLIYFDLFGTNSPTSGVMDIGAVLNAIDSEPPPEVSGSITSPILRVDNFIVQ